jgi:hypothetical protein
MGFRIMDGVDSQPVAAFAADVGAPSRTFSPTDLLAGIIDYLSEKGVVNVTCSAPADGLTSE